MLSENIIISYFLKSYRRIARFFLKWDVKPDILAVFYLSRVGDPFAILAASRRSV